MIYKILKKMRKFNIKKTFRGHSKSQFYKSTDTIIDWGSSNRDEQVNTLRTLTGLST